jgi:uncharacterized protein (DUF1015 family)
MADVQPFRALHYDRDRVGGLEAVVAPPYDVIDAGQRAALIARSPHNVVEIDLPQANGDPYAHAASVFERWQAEGILTRDAEPALWALEQEYTGPDGRARTRRGFLARVGIEDYGPGRIRPHERTHPGPKEDRLRLTRATEANLSPIFSLYDDPDRTAYAALEAAKGEPWAQVTDEDGTTHRLWRIADPQAAESVRAALRDKELLIADGHHRYETARVHHAEGGAGHVLMCLVALQDPAEQLEPGAATDGQVQIGYLDAHHRRPLMLTRRDPEIARAALPDKPEPYRALDTAVLEALILKQALGMTEDDISHLHGLDYARDTAQARQRVEAGEAAAAFFMGATPVDRVRDVAATGESMPPKSTYFFPKVLTGMVFNPLD